MRHWRRFGAKLTQLFRRRSSEKDLDREVTAHLALLADEFESRGMTQQEARQAAQRTFGSVAEAKQLSREERSLLWIEQAWQDLRHASRSLVRSPGFTLVALITLALGIGVDTTLFTTYNSLALKPLPVAKPSRVVRLERWFKRSRGDIQYDFSHPEYVYFRDHNDVFTGVVAASLPVRVLAEIRRAGAAAPDPERLQGELVSGNYFPELGVIARPGRTLDSHDDAVSAPAVVLSNAFWQRRFNGDPGVVGQTIVMNGVVFTISGVAPEEFNGTSINLQVPDFWAPLSMQSQLVPGIDWAHAPETMQLQILARLKPLMTLKQAQAQTDALIRQFSSSKVSTAQERDQTVAVTLQHTSFLGNTEDPRFQAAVAGLMLIVGMVLLVACANIANMLLARGAGRQREIGVRLALGASRNRIVRHLLTESILLSSAGGAAGLLVSMWASKMLWVMIQQVLSGPLTAGLVVKVDLSPDLRVFAYTLLLAVATGIGFGLSPALQFTRPDLTTALKQEGTLFGQRLSRSRLRGVLMSVQVTVSMLLLVSAGLLIRGMIRAQGADAGFETRRVFMLSAAFGETPSKAAVRERLLMDQLRTLPGVKTVGLGYAPLLGTWTPPILAQSSADSSPGRTLASYASDTYLDALNISLLRGRAFTHQEAVKGDRVAVISESTARRYWPEQDPLGKRFGLDLLFRGNYTEFQVVGIAKDVRFANLTRVDPAHVYLPTNASEPYPMLLRFEGDSQQAMATARSAVSAVDKTMLPGLSVMSLEDGPLQLHKSLAQTMSLFAAILAGLSLALASAGIYGVMSFVVSQRTKEIGIRIALGATANDVFKDVVVQGLRPVFAGIVLGAAGAGLLSWLLHTSLSFPGASDFLYGVPFYDPATFLGLSVFLIVVALSASGLPARSALKVDPVVTLRYE